MYGYGILNNHVPTLRAAMRGGSAPSPLLTSLYAVYKAESNANDSLATYNGTAQGGLTYTAGKSGNAFVFNGTNAFVSLPNNAFTSFTGDFSISAWVYMVDNGSLQTIFSCKAYDGTNAWGINLFVFGYSRFDITNGTATAVTLESGGNMLSYNTWHNVVVTRKASTRTRIYHNGTLVASNTSTTNPIFNPVTNKCAIVAYDLSYTFGSILLYAGNGTKIDEVNTWTKELTSTEITELYNTGTGKFYPY